MKHKIELLYDKIESDHYSYVYRLTRDQTYTRSSDKLNIGGMEYHLSPLSLLLKIISYFADQYLNNGKIDISIWKIKKNFNFAIKIYQFFRDLWRYYSPDDEEMEDVNV